MGIKCNLTQASTPTSHCDSRLLKPIDWIWPDKNQLADFSALVKAVEADLTQNFEFREGLGARLIQGPEPHAITRRLFPKGTSQTTRYPAPTLFSAIWIGIGFEQGLRLSLQSDQFQAFVEGFYALKSRIESLAIIHPAAQIELEREADRLDDLLIQVFSRRGLSYSRTGWLKRWNNQSEWRWPANGRPLGDVTQLIHETAGSLSLAYTLSFRQPTATPPSSGEETAVNLDVLSVLKSRLRLALELGSEQGQRALIHPHSRLASWIHDIHWPRLLQQISTAYGPKDPALDDSLKTIADILHDPLRGLGSEN